MLKNGKKLIKLRIKIKKNENFLKIQSNFFNFSKFWIEKIFWKFKKILRGIPRGGFELHALPPFDFHPYFNTLKHHRFNVLKTFWIFWKLINIHRMNKFQKLEIHRKLVPFSEKSESFELSEYFQILRQFRIVRKFPQFTQFKLFWIVWQFQIFPVNLWKKFSTGWSGLYTIFKAHVVKNFYQKITW